VDCQLLETHRLMLNVNRACRGFAAVSFFLVAADASSQS